MNLVKASKRNFRVSHSQDFLDSLAAREDGTDVDGFEPVVHGRNKKKQQERKTSAAEPLMSGECIVVNKRVRIEVVQGDITEEETDAIVNSTDDTLGMGIS